MELRQLNRNEVELLWAIDRPEVHHQLFRIKQDELTLVPAYFKIEGWNPSQTEAITASLYESFDAGGMFMGVFENEIPLGIAVSGPHRVGTKGECTKLDKLSVSQDGRKTGIGTRLFEWAKSVAQAQKSKFLYVSATPTENTVNFYLHRGCRLADPPDPPLLELEPEDIHLICPV